MGEGSDLNEHITKMTELASRLKDLKDEVTSKKFATVILGSLPTSYNHFLTSLNARDASTLDWDQIKPLLLEEYMLRKEKRGSEDALMTRRNPGGNDWGFSNRGDHRNGGGSLRGNPGRGRGGFRGNFNSRSGGNDSYPVQGNSRGGGNLSRGGGGNLSRGGGSFSRGGGHLSQGHELFRNNDNNHQNRNQSIICFLCHESGHKSMFCPNIHGNNTEEGYLVHEGTNGRRNHNPDDSECSPSKRRRLNGNNNDESLYFEDDVALSSSIDDERTGEEWYIDSAASSHMTFNKDVLHDYEEYEKPSNVFLGDNTHIPALGQGKVDFKTSDNVGNKSDLNLKPVLHVPDLAKNLISVRSITEHEDAAVVFDKKERTIYKDDKKFVIGSVSDGGKLYKMNNPPRNTNFANVVVNNSNDKEHSVNLWHQRLCHVNTKYMEKMVKNNMVDGLSICTRGCEVSCEPCIMGKMQRSSCPKESQHRATQLLEVIHTDLCGPMQVDSVGGSRYLITFTDDFSRYTVVYFMKNKGEVLEKFKSYTNLVENRTSRRIKTLNIWSSVKSVRSDNGGEYLSNAFKLFCSEKGIVQELTNPYTPEQNGVSERLNRTIVEAVRSMLIHSNLPLSFWAEAVRSAVYVLNRTPTSALCNVTPYECWFGYKPDLSNLKVFGCICYYHIPDKQRKKLDPKARKAVFVGYPDNVKGYKIMDIDTWKFVRSRNIKFMEREFHTFESEVENKWGQELVVFPKELEEEDRHSEHIVGNSPVVRGNVNEMPPIDNNNYNENILESVDEPDTNPVGVVQKTYEKTFMQSVDNIGEKRTRKPPSRLLEECNIVEDELCLSMESLLADIDEPRSFKKALQSPYASEWKSAMDKEYDSLMKNETWDLVPRPEGVNVVGNRWVYKVKRKSDGSIDKFKARLVAQGYTQTKGVDYSEVFSPVARYQTIRSLLAIGNAQNLEIHQMDVCTAFLNGDLDFDVYMEQPTGYSNCDPNYVCKLKKALYGLKQAARCWNSTLHEFMLSSGYSVSSADGCVYLKSEKTDNGNIKFVIFPFYVDDVVPVSNDIEMLEREKAALCSRFELVDNGEISHVLGLTVKRDRESRIISISQPSYLQEVLARFRMDHCNPVSTPLEAGRQFTKFSDGDVPFDKEIYQQAIGCLTYASTSTRPDISAAVGALSQHMSQPSTDHWSGVKRVLRYIKGTLNYGLIFTAGDGILHGYSDADWAGDPDSRLSTSGYVFRIGDATVSWSCKKQRTVARSSTEAEYVSLSFATQEAVWLRRLLQSIGFGETQPTVMFEDNNGAIDLTKNAKHHNRTKHIDIAHHFAREKVEQKEIIVTHCPSKDMIADIMTKGIPRVQFQRLRDLLGVRCVDW